MVTTDTDPTVYRVKKLIFRHAIERTAVDVVRLVRSTCERELQAAVGDAPVVEERETRRYFDRLDQSCKKNDEWTFMEFVVTWFL